MALQPPPPSLPRLACKAPGPTAHKAATTPMKPAAAMAAAARPVSRGPAFFDADEPEPDEPVVPVVVAPLEVVVAPLPPWVEHTPPVKLPVTLPARVLWSGHSARALERAALWAAYQLAYWLSYDFHSDEREAGRV